MQDFNYRYDEFYTIAYSARCVRTGFWTQRSQSVARITMMESDSSASSLSTVPTADQHLQGGIDDQQILVDQQVSPQSKKQLLQLIVPSSISEALPPPTYIPYKSFDDSNGKTSTRASSYGWHVALAVIALAFAFPFGLVALILSVTARTRNRSYIKQDRRSASKRGVASICISLSGLFVTAIVVISAATSGSSSYGDEATTTTTTVVTPHVTLTKLTRSSLTLPTPATSCVGYWYGGHCYAYRIVWNESDVRAVIARRRRADLSDHYVSDNNVTEVWTMTTMTTTGGGNATNASIIEPQSPTSVSTQPTLLPPPSALQACQFGVPDVIDPWLCYYNDRYNASGSPISAAPCHGGDWRPVDDFCYRTLAVHEECTSARNYHNSHCYEYLLQVANATECRHGYYYALYGACYYNAGFRSTDPSCLGFKADRRNPMTSGDDGWCYYSNRHVCRFAANYHSGKCYDYVLPHVKRDDCRHGYFARGNCYYVNAVPADGTNCDASKADAFGFYCYRN